VSASNCIAVGSAGTPSVFRPLVERWNGVVWSIVASPKPVGFESQLAAVKCVSASNCAAVGTFVVSSVFKTLTERWNGASWSILASPNPAGATLSSLYSVSCLNALSCVAVGSAIIAGVAGPLVEQWNGAAWSILANPTVTATTNSSLHGVVCVGASNCVAVGSAGSKTLIERWNGVEWSIVASPNPIGATGSTLNSVACLSAPSCVAVGTSNVASVYKTLAERYS